MLILSKCIDLVWKKTVTRYVVFRQNIRAEVEQPSHGIHT